MKQIIKKGKIKFAGIVFYDLDGKPKKVIKPSRGIKKLIETYLNNR